MSVGSCGRRMSCSASSAVSYSAPDSASTNRVEHVVEQEPGELQPHPLARSRRPARGTPRRHRRSPPAPRRSAPTRPSLLVRASRAPVVQCTRTRRSAAAERGRPPGRDGRSRHRSRRARRRRARSRRRPPCRPARERAAHAGRRAAAPVTRLDLLGVEHTLVLRKLEHRGPLLEGALLRHPEVVRGKLRVLVPEHLGELRRRPHVVGALDMPAGPVVAVGVERGREPALRSCGVRSP